MSDNYYEFRSFHCGITRLSLCSVQLIGDAPYLLRAHLLVINVTLYSLSFHKGLDINILQRQRNRIIDTIDSGQFKGIINVIINSEININIYLNQAFLEVTNKMRCFRYFEAVEKMKRTI